MKHLPLWLQIWVVVAGTTVGISLLLMVLIPVVLNNFFTKEMYGTIAHAQNLFFPSNQPERFLESASAAERDLEQQNVRSVKHILLGEDGRPAMPQQAPQELVRTALEQARNQTADQGKYHLQLNDQQIYYLISKGTLRGRNVYVISYMWDTYYKGLVRTLNVRLLQITGVITLLSWLPSFWLAAYLSRPLVKLEEHVQQIAGRNWQQPIRLRRRDEIGRLADSIERMRVQLLRQDEAQQSMLQHTSHELKTPVMVIRSYVQSIQDGIYPKGDLASSVEVIDHEAQRLEKRVHDLLYLTKLDYFATVSTERQRLNLAELAKAVTDRLRWRRSELVWELDLEPEEAWIAGDPEQWQVAIENLLDNQIRYAATRICVQIAAAADSITLRIANDGPPVPNDMMEHMFNQFQKGYKGQFGLGLAIVQRIASLHGAQAYARNEPPGIAFYLTTKAAPQKER